MNIWSKFEPNRNFTRANNLLDGRGMTHRLTQQMQFLHSSNLTAIGCFADQLKLICYVSSLHLKERFHLKKKGSKVFFKLYTFTGISISNLVITNEIILNQPRMKLFLIFCLSGCLLGAWMLPVDVKKLFH